MERWSRFAAPAVLLLPGAAVVDLAFNAGGFFPGTPAFAAIILLQVLILWVLLTEDPFAGLNRTVLAVALLVAAYAGWTLLSATWSDSVWRALVEFDRALLYLIAVVLFGSVGSSSRRLRWLIWGLAAALVVVCVSGLVTRILPDVWPTDANVENERLAYPVGYWNGFGAMAAIGLVLCLHLASRARGSVASRVLGAAAVPALATALFFTFSRGAVIAAVIGLVAYVAVARPRGLIPGLLATGPATAVALVVAYGADQLATPFPDTPEGVSEGKDVALVLAVCVLAAAGVRLGLARLLDRRLAAREHVIAPRTGRIALGGGLAAALLVFVALGGPGWVGDQYGKFAEGAGEVPMTDLRDRFTDVGNNGRIDHWEVALDAFGDERLRGTGAGTYQLEWDRERDLNFAVIDAHGLYFEVAGELGLVGLLLLLAAVLTVLGGLLWRARGDLRPEYGAVFAACLTWAAHAGVDWDWELASVTLPFFAAGAAALGARVREDEARNPFEASWRVPLAVGLVLVAVTPVLMAISQGRLVTAAASFGDGDCGAAVDEALEAASVLAVRPEPYEIVGYCQVQRGFPRQGVAAMEKAVDRDERNWEYQYGLAVARAAAGLDPRAAAARAKQLNPREAIVDDLAKRLRTADPSAWPDEAERARTAIYESGLLSLP